MKTKILLLLTLVLSLSYLSYAQPSYKSKAQHQRLRHGYKSGALTPAEWRRMAYPQKYVHRDARRSKCSGRHISRAEKARLMHDQQIAGWYKYHFNNNNRKKF